MKFLPFPQRCPLEAGQAGLFHSEDFGSHSDRTTPFHQLFLVRSGCLYIEEEGREFRVEKEETLLLWPGCRHRGTIAYGKDLSFYWIHFRIWNTWQGESFLLPQHTKPKRIERLTELFHRYLGCQKAATLTPEEGNFIVSLMLLELRHSATGTSASISPLSDRAARFIDENFRRGIHAGDVAKILGCNLDYLGNVYRRTFGCTLSHAIHRKQIEEARVMLLESNKNMEEIASACGFRDSRYFRKLFAKHHGISPRIYRRLYA